MGVTVKGVEADSSDLWNSSMPASLQQEQAFRHTVSLIRGTSHRCSLFDVRVEGFPVERVASLVRAQFDSEAQVETVRAGHGQSSVWILFVRTGGGDHVLESRVRTTLHAALADTGFDKIRFGIDAVHRDARMMVDLDDLTAELRTSRNETPAGIFH
ncbi:hypothetical protein [Fodinicurvata sp. EGI_FJ10296]|jgi:hypothetical protein|uniref:hypothetical protein n=1 Tax=Fodinicurvata sp. EGI_FJ10296 TaxID=3231908 RepID=UPI003452DDFB